jgi:predicted Rossmann-fold nucleotide-binding protein/SAM-dependent methyltransferase
MPTNIKLPIKPADANGHAPLITNRLINNVTFFGDSAIPEGDPFYTATFEAAKLLAQNGYTVVNGGGPGIMKAATDGAESVNGRTIAIYWEPKLASFFEGKNLANITDESETASNYIIRTLGLIEKGDAYVICKGGTGTVSEFGMVWCLAKLYYGVHKPVILYGDFWDDLIVAFQKSMYIDEVELSVLYQAKTPQDIIDLLKRHEEKIKLAAAKKIATGDEAGFVLSSIKSDIASAYDEHASDYHAHHAGNLVAQEQLDDFIKLVNPPARILDIGCGPGYDAGYLANRYSVTGVEISKRFADIAKFENPNVEIVNMDILKFDLGHNQYKGIWARDSIHHLNGEDLTKLFPKIYDSLVEGGIFYTIVREGEGEIREKENGEYFTMEKFFHLFSVDELQDRAQKAGFKTVKIERTKRSHSWLVGVFMK